MRACFIFLLCMLMTSANKSLEKKNFPSSWKCYKTIILYIICVFIKIWSTWEVWRALKKLELLSAMPCTTLTHLSCSPNKPVCFISWWTHADVWTNCLICHSLYLFDLKEILIKLTLLSSSFLRGIWKVNVRNFDHVLLKLY